MQILVDVVYVEQFLRLRTRWREATELAKVRRDASSVPTLITECFPGFKVGL